LGGLDAAANEWIGLIAYRLMGKTDALFPGRRLVGEGLLPNAKS
jgi:hypothetical protein